MIPFAFTQLLEAADGLWKRRVFANPVCEDFGHDEWLRQDSLDPAGTVNDQLVFFGKLIDTQNRNDVTKLAVSLKDRLHLTSHSIMLFTHILRVKDPA